MTGLDTAERLNVQFFSTSTLTGHSRQVLSNGNTLLPRVRVFRTGTFKDSMGVQHTWEPEHLEQMVFHFNLLRDRGIFVNVPWRDGHKEFFGGGGDVVGWISDLSVEDGFLLADVEITEPDALEKVDRGTFRNRSAEVGFYETNDEALYWPVLMGVAFVDIGAVEGLFKREPTRKFSLLTDGDSDVSNKEMPVSGTNSSSNGDESVQTTATPPANPKEAAPVQAPPPAAQHAAPVQAPPPAAQHAAPPAVEQPAATSTSPTASNAGSTFTFSINGQATTDFGAVQQHITVLETTLREQEEQARRDFVNGLASSNRIAAPQVESLTAHALSLSDEQYKTFRASYEAAPSVSLLGQHGNGVTNPNGDGGVENDEIATLTEIVANHRRAKMTEEQIQKTASYRRLQELTSANKT